MFLEPCHRCLPELRIDCELHKSKLAILRGSGITKASFKCPNLTQFLFPGLQVKARFRITYYDDMGYRNHETYQGTIMGFSKSGKVKVWINNSGGDVRQVVTLWPNRLTILFNQPIKNVCLECGCPEGEKNPPKEDRMENDVPRPFDCATCKSGVYDPAYEHDGYNLEGLV